MTEHWVLSSCTCAALSEARVLGAQVGSVVVGFVEVVLFPLLVEILEAVQHGVSVLLVN